MSSSSSEAEFDDDEDVDEEEEEEEEDDDRKEYEQDSDDDAPIASLRRSNNNCKKRSAPKVTHPNGDDCSSKDYDDDDDDDDDIPLSALATKRNGGDTKKSPAKKVKQSSTTASVASSAKSSTTSRKDYEWRSAALYGTESTKGLLIQRLLCRWWYAITWPDPAKLIDPPPKHYDALDGFPGVYVCTEGGKVGHIRDIRGEPPSFDNFLKKTSAELQHLLLQALLAQKQQLIEHEGSGTETEQELERLIKWTTKIKPEKADNEASKVLKAHGFNCSSNHITIRDT